MLGFLQKCSIFCFLDNHNYSFYKSYDCLAGAGVVRSVGSDANDALQQIDQLRLDTEDWIFGHVSYDMKNEIEELESHHLDLIGFPDFLFFVPEIVFIIKDHQLHIGVFGPTNPRKIYNDIILSEPGAGTLHPPLVFRERFSKSEYLATVHQLRQHILRGDCYEINFCQEFFAEGAVIDPVAVYRKLSDGSPNPFAAFYRYEDKYLLCASPERFLKKAGHSIISQPIKGTLNRIVDDPLADEDRRKQLLDSDKERAENIMIVDLVRNDLGKICSQGSVVVDELQKVYAFPQVHQMISTISGTLMDGIGIADILQATFPMGSMTGAPKKRVMELIEKYERTRRGLFSGTVGYIDPEGDFDCNVVIRSIQYNALDHFVSIQAGSAITWKSDPEKEYEECLLKIAPMKKALE